MTRSSPKHRNTILNTYAVVVLLGPLVAIPNCAAQVSGHKAAVRKSAAAVYGKLPLSFEANQGQTAGQVQFLARGSGYALFLTNDSAVIALDGSHLCQTARSAATCSTDARDVVQMTLAGPSRLGHSATAVAEDELPGKRNYFVGSDPTQWHTNVPTYAKVRYRGVYPGVDLVYYGDQGQLEYDFVVAPNANPDSIRLQFAGGKRIAVAANGDLKLEGIQDSPAFRQPVAYQEIEGHRQPVSSSFKLLADNTVGFKLGKYDCGRPLVIDPILVYSTYLGGSGNDSGSAVAVDSAGNAYVVGTTGSMDFPATPGAYQTTNKSVAAGHGGTAFVAKFNPAGTALVYATYLGGTGQAAYTPPYGSYGPYGEAASAIAIDPSGNAYVTGVTFSKDFPVTPGAFQTVNKSAGKGEGSAFVAKLNAAGDALDYATYLGGTAAITCFSYEFPFLGQAGLAIAVDGAGDAYVAGDTTAPDFPVTAGALQPKYAATSLGGTNGFVSKLNPTGTALIYSTYLGGSGSGAECYVKGDYAAAISLDNSGDAYVAGTTASANFSVTPGAYQTVNHAADTLYGTNAFVAKLNPAGSAALFSTFLGGSKLDGASAMALDSAGNIYLSGITESSDFPVSTDAIYPTIPGYTTGFVAKLNAEATALEYGTYLGPAWSSLSGLAVDSSGNAYVTGNVGDGIFATTPGAVTQFTSLDTSLPDIAYVAKLNPTATALEYATMLGSPSGSNSATGNAVALDADGNLYVTGYAAGNDFPTTAGAFQTVDHNSSSHGIGAGNAFLAKLALAGQTSSHYPTTISLAVSSALIPQGQPVTLTATVASGAGVGAATGVVSFVTRAGPVNATLNASGIATWTSSTLPPGLYTAGVYYQGDATHLSSAAAANNFASVTFRVVGPPSIITLADPNGNPAVIRYGNSIAPLSITVADSTGYPLQGVAINFTATPGLNIIYGYTLTNSSGIAYMDSYSYTVGSFTAQIAITGYPTPLSFGIQILPAPLTVTIHSTANSRLYGAANPTFTNTVSGLVGSETVTVTDTLAATPASPVGSYPVSATISGPDASHYTLTVDGLTLQVTKAPLYISAKNVAITYGQNPPPLTAYTLTGFVNGDTTSVVSGAPVLTTTVTSTTPVGAYKIGVQIGTLTATNYSFDPFSSGEGAVTVNKAPLTIRPNSVTIHEGNPLPSFTYTLTGFVNGDTQASATTGAPALTTTAPNTNTPGRYYIIANVGTLAAKNYAFNPPSPTTNGILTILAN
jgi:hypothetical protein